MGNTSDESNNYIKEGSCRSTANSPVPSVVVVYEESTANSPVPSVVVYEEDSSGYQSSAAASTSNSPAHTLKRSSSSTFKLIDRRTSNNSTSQELLLPAEATDGRSPSVLDGDSYPHFILRIYVEIFGTILFILLQKIPTVIPVLWLSGCLWCLNKVVTFVLSVTKKVCVTVFQTDELEYPNNTVLISGGSTVQSIHLARNFSSAGARVIVCEVEGEFPLARFCTAARKFYTVPKPNDRNIDDYIDRLKQIVVTEKVKCYIPVSEVNGAYYDAVVKPHLRILGCETICPEVNEVLLFDDLSELMKQVRNKGLPTPDHYTIGNFIELNKLYECGVMVKEESYTMISVGTEGCKNRLKVVLPRYRRELNVHHLISEQKPWLVVQKCRRGEEYVTCTTVRDSKVICNVTCKVVHQSDAYVQVEKPEVDRWLEKFFAALAAPHRARINGHISFYFTILPKNGGILTTDCRVGVRLPYIYYSVLQAQRVWKPCVHFNRRTLDTVVSVMEKYWFSQAVARILNNLMCTCTHRIRQFLATFWGRNDALFVPWDPLPYCAHYYVQSPLMKAYTVYGKLRRSNITSM